MKKILIEKGKEFQIYTRKLSEDEDIFKEQYKMAENIRKNLMEYAENREKQPGTWEHLNNIIAFCGERGQGKSSAMFQFTRDLQKNEDMEVLEPIDPTALETAHDILDIVVSRMFEQYRLDREQAQKGEMGIPHFTSNMQLELAEAFQRVHRNLAVLKNSGKFIEEEYVYHGSIQNLADIADSMRLKQEFSHLTSLYLECRDKKMLVIALDDLDLNISTAYRMLEQIRKYMMLPGIFVVMAVNISQLTLCVEQQFLAEMKELGNSRRFQVPEEAGKMADKYMEKLFPLARRLHLPDIRAISYSGESSVEIIYQDEKQVIFDSENRGIEQGILGLIYDRTGLALVPKEDEVHPIVPQTLRELVGMIALMGTMELTPCKRNVEILEEYLFTAWAEHNLFEDDRQWFLRLRQEPLKRVHKVMFRYLYALLEERAMLGDTLKSSIEGNIKTAARTLKTKGIGNGAIVNCIRLCERAEDTRLDRLAFAITSFLSLVLLKLSFEQADAKLVKLTGDNLFGSFLLIRGETNGLKQYSRLHYEYDVKAFWSRLAEKIQAEHEDNPVIPLKTITVFGIQDYFSQFDDGREKLLRILYSMGGTSAFLWSDGGEKGMVAGNHYLAETAEFSLNRFLAFPASDQIIMENIRGEKWNITEEEKKKLLWPNWENYQKLCRLLACNMELGIYLGRFLVDTRDIKDKTEQDIVHYYRHFYKCLCQGLAGLNGYLDLPLQWMREEAETGFSWLSEELAAYWSCNKKRNRESGQSPDGQKESERIEQNVPSRAYRNNRIGKMREKLRELETAVLDKELKVSKEEQAMLQEWLSALKEEFALYAERHLNDDPINDSLAIQFNQIVTALKS